MPGLSQVTVGERILVHLLSFLRFSEAFEVPREMTQDGIAHALGISRAHAALELKRLRAANRVEERVAHVAGARTRRKVYILSHTGVAQGRDLRDHARAKPVLLVDGGDRREAAGGDAIEALRARGVREAEATQLVLVSDVVDVRSASPTREPRRPPASEVFVDREAELAALRAWLASPEPLALLVGVAGIGKSALAARAAAEFAGPSWFRKVYGFEDGRTLAGALAEFLAGLDRPRLRNYLAAGGFDPVDLGAILRQDLRGVLLVVDDLHASREAVGLVRLAADSGPGKVLATARERPDGLPVAGGFPEIPLGALPRDAACALARALLPRDGDAEELSARGRGHPFAIRLLAAAAREGRAARPDPLLEDAILEGLDGELERAAIALAVLRKREARPATLGVTSSQVRRLAARGLLAGDAGGVALHDLARDVLLPRAPERILRDAHRAALRSAGERGDWIEAAHHATAGGLPRRARELLVGHGPELVDSPAVGELVRILSGLPRSSRARLLLAEALDRLGRAREARDELGPLVSSRPSRRRAEALVLLGRIASRSNALNEAEDRLSEGIRLAGELGDPRTEGVGHRVLGIVRRKAGDLASAEGELRTAVALLDDRDPREGIRARLDLAVIALQRGEGRAAIEDLEALLLRPGVGAREEAAIRTNLAIAKAGAGEDALPEFEAGALAAERAGDFRAAAYALANAADGYVEAGRVGEAENAIRRARELSAPYSDAVLESTILTNEGKVLALQGRPEGAEVRLREGVERLRESGNVLSLIARVDELARFYERSGRTEEAERWRSTSEGLRSRGPLPLPRRERG